MCGIAGLVGDGAVEGLAEVERACASLAHRGPDAHGLWTSQCDEAVIGHQRLAIVDLTAAARQPMVSTCQRFCVTFNGEIYNYQEISKELAAAGRIVNGNSDTAVLVEALSAWGLSALRRLRGMFAIAALDRQERVLHLIRDRIGEKPLFYRQRGRSIAFASENTAVPRIGKSPDKICAVALSHYLAYGYLGREQSILAGIAAVEPGGIVTFDIRSGRLTRETYWSPLEPGYGSSAKEDGLPAAIETTKKLLADAVAEQLQADVPIGVLLSGGLDSSLVTAFAAQRSQPVRTFTVTFPNAKTHDESKFASDISRFFGTRHEEVPIADPDEALVVKLAGLLDAPLADSSLLPTYLVSRAISTVCKVAVGGDGADELFGGYRRYLDFLSQRQSAQAVPRYLLTQVARFATHVLPPGFPGRVRLQAMEFSDPREAYATPPIFDAVTRSRLLPEIRLAAPHPEDLMAKLVPETDDVLADVMLTDIRSYLPGDILFKTDRASMANSLEMRAPFLSAPLVEYALKRLGSQTKLHRGQGKAILKAVAKDLLPPGYDLARKKGFSVPMANWMRSGGVRHLVHETLLSRNSPFAESEVRLIIRGHDLGFNNGERLYALAMFELWRKSHRVDF